MHYTVKEMFYSLQGEGARTGRPAVFCRFTGCNLWSGKEKHRATAQCDFCDTDFVGTNGAGGGEFDSAENLAENILSFWPHVNAGKPYVVFTGGEPLLQLNAALVTAMHQRGFEIAVETNGTLVAPEGVDWLCVSPKGQSKLAQQSGNELKLVYPQTNVDPAKYTDLSFEQFYLQPLENDEASNNLQVCLQYCLEHPQWHLSLQMHKTLGIR